MSRAPCPYCARTFADQNAVWMHAKVKHPRQKTAHLRPARPPEDESMASLMIGAQQRIAQGEPVEGWLRDMLP